jgi:hypothetical protein
MVCIKGKIQKDGHSSYKLRIRKALIDCRVLELNKEYEFNVLHNGAIVSIGFFGKDKKIKGINKNLTAIGC